MSMSSGESSSDEDVSRDSRRAVCDTETARVLSIEAGQSRGRDLTASSAAIDHRRRLLLQDSVDALQQRQLQNLLTRTIPGSHLNTHPRIDGVGSLVLGSMLHPPYHSFAADRGVSYQRTLPLNLNDDTLLRPLSDRQRLHEQRHILDSQLGSFNPGRLELYGPFISNSLHLQQLRTDEVNLQRNTSALEAELQRRLNARTDQSHVPNHNYEVSTDFARSSCPTDDRPSTRTMPEAGRDFVAPAAASCSSIDNLQGIESAGGPSIAHQLGELKKPSRPLTAYNIFFKNERLRLIAEEKAAETEGPAAGIPFALMGKKIGSKWKELSDEDRQPYVDAAQEHKLRHEQEKKAYNARKESLLASHQMKQLNSVEPSVLSKYYKDHEEKHGSTKRRDKGKTEDGAKKPKARKRKQPGPDPPPP